MFGVRHSLHRGVREAKLFYASYAAMVALAAAIVLIPHAPQGLITTAVQALAGIMLPSATVFAVLLCNGPRRTRTMGQTSPAQRDRRRDRRGNARSVADPGGLDRDPFHRT